MNLNETSIINEVIRDKRDSELQKITIKIEEIRILFDFIEFGSSEIMV